MTQSIYDKASASYPFYSALFKRLCTNDLLYQTGKAKLLKDMNDKEYEAYNKYLIDNVIVD